MAFSTRHMTITLAILVGLASLLLAQVGARGQAQEAPPGEAVEVEDGKTFAAERLIVTYEPAASEATEIEAVEEVEGEVEDEISRIDADVVALRAVEDERPGKARKDALERARQNLADEPGVESVDYDYLRKPSYTPDDPRFSKQWNMKRPDFPVSWGESRKDDGETVRLAVVDSGIDSAHPDLKGKILYLRDYVGDDSVAEDNDGHGTQVAGIAAASTDNGIGIASGCPDCRLLIAKALSGEGGFDSNIADGIVWSAESGAEVINLSLGGPGESVVLENAVDYAHNKGAVVVAAAGNSGKNIADYPAAYSNVIAVAATNQKDRQASFSSYGSYVDVAAPGVNILSTDPGGYASISGTSMASPHVAALAGLLADEGLTKTDIRSRILYTAKDLGPKGRDSYYGTGRIDAARALE